MPNPPIDLGRVTLATHLFFTGYGHWLPNELRGSGSSKIRKDELKPLGDIHHGRKRVQPSHDELRDFHRKADSLLEYPVLWFDDEMRQVIAAAFARVILLHNYTCWACAILRDHAHLLIRTHKHRSQEMWDHFAKGATQSLRAIATVPTDHPVWSARPYGVLLFSRPDVVKRVPYIEGNPAKHQLPDQRWDFVTPCLWI